jgi:hypothetical protein
VSSYSPLGVDKVFLDSCKELSDIVMYRSTTHEFIDLNLDEDREVIISEAECPSVFYANAAYDFYGTPAVLCVSTRMETAGLYAPAPSPSGLLERLVAFTVILCKPPGVSSASTSTPCSTM